MGHSKNIPPRFATALLRSFLRQDLAEDVIGDMQEQFDYALQRRSRFQAKLNYWLQVVHYLRPFAIRKMRPSYQNPATMYEGYLKTTLRRTIKNKMLSLVTIVGLSVGIAVAGIVSLWMADELSFEKNFYNYSTIGRVIQNVTNNGQVETWRAVPYPLADELRSNYPTDFKRIVMTTGAWNSVLDYDGKKLSQTGTFAEPEFAELFSLTIVKGTGKALLDASSLLISESLAKIYFDHADPIGKIMMLDDRTLHVGGVYKDIPQNSLMSNIHFIGSFETIRQSGWFKDLTDPWRPNGFELYVQLNEGATFTGASARIRNAKLKKVNPDLAKKKPELFIHPMSRWHLYDEFVNGKQTGGRIQYVWMFGITGAFVLLMACINFMNLSTAQSEKRSREIGIRKAIGSLRSELVSQFLSESLFTVFFSLMVSLVIIQLSLPWFNIIAAKQMQLPWNDPTMWVICISASVLIGMIAGSYPALYLSSIRAGIALKGAFKPGRGAAIPRKVLVVIQFTVSITLIIGTLIVFLQIRYAQNRPMGYSANGLLSVPISSSQLHEHFNAVRTELIDAGAITQMAEASTPTTEIGGSSSGYDWRGKDPNLSVDFSYFNVSTDYGKTIQWKILAGRDFSKDFQSDSSAFILNEAASNFIGSKELVGETIWWHSKPFKVVGIVKDVVISSPYQKVRPVIYCQSSQQQGVLIIRINPETPTHEALSLIETTARKHLGNQPFSYTFIDQEYARKFNNEQRIAVLACVLATLAIFIGCLGTFGLSSFMAERRTKEIGVRKIMGASTFQLWGLISREFLILSILSCMIAIPIAYQILSSWLQGYHYRTSMPWWIFLVSIGGTITINMITASWHVLHAANLNPVKSLRNE